MNLKELHRLRGLKACYIPYELTDDGWQQNPEHEEEVTLLEYFNDITTDNSWMGITWHIEGILFIRQDMTLGRDRLDAFTITK